MLKKIFSNRLILLLFLLLAICVLPIYIIFLIFGIDVYNARSAEVQQLVKNNPIFFEKIFQEILPKAINCNKTHEDNCSGKTRAQIEQLLSPPFLVDGKYPSYYASEEKRELALVVNLPMYFITLNNSKIVKLFFSGDLKVEDVNTLGEFRVLTLLDGLINSLYGMHGNDSFLQMTYLNDHYSEAEVIVPYKLNGKTIGAIVFLHGD